MDFYIENIFFYFDFISLFHALKMEWNTKYKTQIHQTEISDIKYNSDKKIRKKW